MTAEVVEVADAVKAELNAGSFSQALTAERHYLPVFELQDMKELRVTVVPRGVVMSTASRQGELLDVKVDVAVQKKLVTGDVAEIDPLVGLVEEIADFFRLRRLMARPRAIWVGTANEPIYDQDHMSQLRQFTSVLTFTFRVAR